MYIFDFCLIVALPHFNRTSYWIILYWWWNICVVDIERHIHTHQMILLYCNEKNIIPGILSKFHQSSCDHLYAPQLTGLWPLAQWCIAKRYCTPVIWWLQGQVTCQDVCQAVTLFPVYHCLMSEQWSECPCQSFGIIARNWRTHPITQSANCHGSFYWTWDNQEVKH